MVHGLLVYCTAESVTLSEFSQIFKTVFVLFLFTSPLLDKCVQFSARKLTELKCDVHTNRVNMKNISTHTR